MKTAERRIVEAEDEAFEQSKRAILYGERPPQPPTEVELLRREIEYLKAKLRLVAEVLLDEHDCDGGDW